MQQKVRRADPICLQTLDAYSSVNTFAYFFETFVGHMNPKLTSRVKSLIRTSSLPIEKQVIPFAHTFA